MRIGSGLVFFVVVAACSEHGDLSDLDMTQVPLQNPKDIASDGGDIFVLNWGTYDDVNNYLSDGSVDRFAAGSPDPQLVIGGLSRPLAMAVDGEYVYVVLEVDHLEHVCSLARVAKSGGELETLANDIGWFLERRNPALELDETYLYFAAQAAGGSDNVFWRLDKTGAEPPEEIIHTYDVRVDGDIYAQVGDGFEVYASDTLQLRFVLGAQGSPIAASGGYLYFLTSTHYVDRIQIESTDPPWHVAKEVGDVPRLAGDYVYWVSSTTPWVFARQLLAGGEVEKAELRDLSADGSILDWQPHYVLAGDTLYVLNTGSLMMARIDELPWGEPPASLAY